MAGINKAIIVGNLGRDPEIRYFQDGSAVANFSVATSESWTDKNTGEKREKTEWHRIVAFRRLAEICAQYLAKGRQVYIEGKIQTREWEDKEGVKRYTTEIVASNMQMLGSRADAGQQGGYQGGYQQGGYQGSGYQGGPGQGPAGGGGYQSGPGPYQGGGYQGGPGQGPAGGGGYQSGPGPDSGYQAGPGPYQGGGYQGGPGQGPAGGGGYQSGPGPDSGYKGGSEPGGGSQQQPTEPPDKYLPNDGGFPENNDMGGGLPNSGGPDDDDDIPF